MFIFTLSLSISGIFHIRFFVNRCAQFSSTNRSSLTALFCSLLILFRSNISFSHVQWKHLINEPRIEDELWLKLPFTAFWKIVHGRCSLCLSWLSKYVGGCSLDDCTSCANLSQSKMLCTLSTFNKFSLIVASFGSYNIFAVVVFCQ